MARIMKFNKNVIAKRIRRSNRPRTHPRKVSGATGLFYMKAGKVHKVNRKRDTSIKAKRTRSRKSDSWRGDIKGTRY